MQGSTERRDKELKTKVRPIKDHLSRIGMLLKVMHETEDDQAKESLIKYSQKDKKITEARKRKNNISLYTYNEKEEEISKGKSLNTLDFMTP